MLEEIAHSGYGLDVKGRSVERPCRGVDAPKQGRFRFGTTPIRGRMRPVMQELSPSIGGNLRQFLHHFKACHKEYNNGRALLPLRPTAYAPSLRQGRERVGLLAVLRVTSRTISGVHLSCKRGSAN